MIVFSSVLELSGTSKGKSGSNGIRDIGTDYRNITEAPVNISVVANAESSFSQIGSTAFTLFMPSYLTANWNTTSVV